MPRNTRGFKEFESHLKDLAKRFPALNGRALNKAAFSARKLAQAGLKKNFTLRNKFTAKSVRVTRVRGFDPRTQVSEVGSVAGYLATQEFGGTITSQSGKHNVPTEDARTGRSRRRLVARPKRMRRIKLSGRRVHAKTRSQKIAVAMAMARRAGQRFAYLPVRGRSGIYELKGGKKGRRIRLIHELERKSVTIRKQPWLKPAVDKIGAELPKIYFRVARKMRLFGR